MSESSTKTVTENNKKMGMRGRNRLITVSIALSLLVTVCFLVGLYFKITEIKQKKVEDYIDLTMTQYVALKSEKLTETAEELFSVELELIRDALKELNLEDTAQNEQKAGTAITVQLFSEDNMILLTDRSGEILLSSDFELNEKNAIEAGIISKSDFDGLISEAETEQLGMIRGKSSQDMAWCCQKVQAENGGSEIFLFLGKEEEKIESLLEGLNRGKGFYDYFIGNNEFAFSILEVDLETGQTLEKDEDGYGGLEELGLTLEEIENADGSWLNSKNGDKVYVRLTDKADSRSAILGVLETSLGNSLKRMVLLAVAAGGLFMVLCIILLMYRSYTKREQQDEESFRSHSAMLILTLTLFFTLFMMALGSILSISWLIQTVEKTEVDLEETLESLELDSDQLQESYQRKELDEAAVLAATLSITGVDTTEGEKIHYYYGENEWTGEYSEILDSFSNPITCMEQAKQLISKKDIIEADSLWVLNEKGYAISSAGEDWNFSLSELKDTDMAELEEDLRDVLFRHEYSLYRTTMDENGTITGTLIAIPVDLYAYNNSNGSTEYLSLQEYRQYAGGDGTKEQQKGLLVYYRKGYSDADQRVELLRGKCYQSFAVTAGCSYVLLREQTNSTGEKEYVIMDKVQGVGCNADLDAVTVPDTMTGAELNFFRTYGNEICLNHMRYKYDSGTYKAMIFGENEMDRFWSLVLFLSMVTGLLGLSLMEVVIMLEFRKEKEAIEEVKAGSYSQEEKEEIKISVLYDEMEFRDNLFRLLLLLLAIPALAIIGNMLPVLKSKMDEGTFVDVFNGTWERGLNGVNAFVAVVLIFNGQVIAFLLKLLCKKVSKPLGSKVESIVQLIFSTLQYLILFMTVMYSFYLFGVDLKNIGTVTTILAGIIAFSSQQIINDLNSGFLLFFEGKIELGKHVMADGFNGTIQSIGFRSCDLLADNGTTRCVPYSRMSSMTVYPEPEEDKKFYTREDLDEMVEQREAKKEQEALAALEGQTTQTETAAPDTKPSGETAGQKPAGNP